MAKYQCTVCKELFDEEIEKMDFLSLPDDWTCPKCSLPLRFFNKVYEKKQTSLPSKLEFYHAIEINPDNKCIVRNNEKCIDCGLCRVTCQTREKIRNFAEGKNCVNCGQCIQACPVSALSPYNDVSKVMDALNSDKICIAYTAPGIRVSLGEAFNLPEGSFVQGKIVSALRQLGFNKVLDLTFGADLTIIEETTELVKRIQKQKNLPMFTSCCPAWVKYAKDNYPEIIPHLSTCKSPMGMQEAVIRTFYADKLNLDESKIFTVAITPCTAKKYEKQILKGPNVVLTTKELATLIKNAKLDFINLVDGDFDSMLGEGSGSGMLFGNTGGVMEAALRTTYKVITNQNLETSVIFEDVRGLSNVKESSIDMNGFVLKIAVVNQMACAIPLIEDVINQKSKYHFIEVMNCLGGCIGGGGQIGYQKNDEIFVKQKRLEALYAKDKESKWRYSHQNLDISCLYQEYLQRPGSLKAMDLLHVHNKEED